MRIATLLSLAAMTVWTMSTIADEPLKVGVYARGVGAGAVAKALRGEQDLQVATFKDFAPEEVLKYDAIYVTGTLLEQPEQIKAMRILLACGGGLVFNHGACGRGKPETLFPAVARKVTDRREDCLLVVQAPEHPVAMGLPAQFEHAYYDHLYLEPGDAGTVVLADRQGAAVVVAGPVGAGRVVFNGALPGYRYDTASFAQAEAEPTTDELRLVVNALRWAGAGTPTALPAEEVAKRREQTERELKMADLDKLLPKPDWFGTEMLTGSYTAPQPVHELGGRFFITYDRQTWRGYSLTSIRSESDLAFYRNRLASDIVHLKWLGVTDIVYWTDVSGNRVSRPTDVPDSRITASGFDPLAELITLATPEGMNVWVAWHSAVSASDPDAESFAEKYCARDGQGRFYKYGGKSYCEDLLSEAYMDRCRAFLDEYALKYKPLGNFMGLATYDEIWFTYADFHGDDLEAIEAFCLERFGEKLPADMTERLARGRAWTDPDDIWRRRYILFKQHVITEFYRRLVGYARERGLQIGLGHMGSMAAHAAGWSFGMDGIALGRLPFDFIIASGSLNVDNARTMRWTHIYQPWGFYNTHCIQGGPGGISFTFNHLWRLIMYGSDPDRGREFARHVHIQRQWANAENLAQIAVLHNQNVLTMLFADPRAEYQRERAVLQTVRRGQSVHQVHTLMPERYGSYRVLIAPSYAVRGLTEEVYAQLRRYVENGGVIVSFDADWTISRPDLTQERDVTAGMVGVLYGGARPAAPASFQHGDQSISLTTGAPLRLVSVPEGDTTVIAAFDDGAPAVTERTLGKGKVLGLHFGVATELDGGGNPALAAWLDSLVSDLCTPAIRLVGGGVHVAAALRKGNWLAVALYPEADAILPVEVRLEVDTAALGLTKTEFRMLMLGKRMEISRPGRIWGDNGPWTEADLKKGFRVTVVADHTIHKPLPESFDLSDFTQAGRRGERDAAYIDNITREWWNNPKRGPQKRDYSFEIVVLAPIDEMRMPSGQDHTPQ